MKRFDKKTMSIYSQEYDELLEKEISVWSTYASGESKMSNFSEVKKTLPYLTYRKGTVELELKYIRDLGENISVLELGSADGWLTNEIFNLENIQDITSIDISLEKNKEKYNAKSIALRGDLNKIDKIPFDQKYDCIITHGTLHHLVDPKKTLDFCLNHLLKENGIIINNDSWVLQSLQLKTNAFLYTMCNRLPHALLALQFKNSFKIITKTLPKIIASKDYAAHIVHAHDTSPFESISSADDYKDIYTQDTVLVLYFKRFAALSGVQSIWVDSPLFVKKIIQSIDDIFIKKNIFSGDAHLCIFKKIIQS